MATKQTLLKRLRKSTGMTLADMCGQVMELGTAPSICPNCGYTTDMEPDQDAGFCENCNSRSVVSFLILADTI